jgi:hypothetical protein
MADRQSRWIMAAVTVMAFCTAGYVLIVWRVAFRHLKLCAGADSLERNLPLTDSNGTSSIHR